MKSGALKKSKEDTKVKEENKKAIEKKEEDNQAPKRPKSGYLVWCERERKKLKEENVKGKEIMKELGKRWLSLTILERKEWQDKADKERKVYEEKQKEKAIERKLITEERRGKRSYQEAHREEEDDHLSKRKKINPKKMIEESDEN